MKPHELSFPSRFIGISGNPKLMVRQAHHDKLVILSLSKDELSEPWMTASYEVFPVICV